MKITCLGDTHGRTIWKDIVAKENDSDLIIFMGDYFDTRDNITTEEQINNFKEIIEFKKNNIDKVILLIGNHDYHYMKGVDEQYSGHQRINSFVITDVIEDALSEDLLQMCYQVDNYIFTHAGVTNSWAKSNEIDVENLQQSINDLFKYQRYSFRFTMGYNFSQTGNDVTQSPIWVRPQSLFRDMISDGVTKFVCVVGHTTMDQLGIGPTIIITDCLGTSQEYLIIENGEPRSSKL